MCVLMCMCVCNEIRISKIEVIFKTRNIYFRILIISFYAIIVLHHIPEHSINFHELIASHTRKMYVSFVGGGKGFISVCSKKTSDF